MLCRSASPSLGDTKICDVAAGSVITLDIHESDPRDRAISESHKGPCIIYMSPLETEGKGNTWFKVYESGYDEGSDTWCVDTLIKNNGKIDFTIPKDIPSGEYMLREEVIALHEADRAYGEDEDAGAEFFPSCALLRVYGSTATAMPKGYAIPGIYTKNDPGIHFNLYDGKQAYTIPGPALYAGNDTDPASATVQDPKGPGLHPACIGKKRRRRRRRRGTRRDL